VLILDFTCASCLFCLGDGRAPLTLGSEPRPLRDADGGDPLDRKRFWRSRDAMRARSRFIGAPRNTVTRETLLVCPAQETSIFFLIEVPNLE